MRGRLNHSGLLVHSLDTLAELWECTPDEAALLTAQNAKSLFGVV
jgi:Tat protein secretion system quality control protein TatD with DNase activity